jgi:hypothetical protein
LHKRSSEAARERDAETEEPKDIYVNGITWRTEWFKRRRSQLISISDPHKFLGNLLKKPRGHVAGIGLEGLVTFDKECGNRRGEYTRLKTVFFKGERGANQPFKNAHK